MLIMKIYPLTQYPQTCSSSQTLTLYTWSPNDPCFGWSFGLVLGGLTFKNRGDWGSRKIPEASVKSRGFLVDNIPCAVHSGHGGAQVSFNAAAAAAETWLVWGGGVTS